MTIDEFVALQNKRKRPAHEESDIQIRLVNWARATYPSLILTSTMGGVNLPVHVAVRLKRMGYLAGIPDLLIFRANHGFNGLLLEVKTKDGKLSSKQKEIQEALISEGYKSVAGYDFDECQRIIKEYLE